MRNALKVLLIFSFFYSFCIAQEQESIKAHRSAKPLIVIDAGHGGFDIGAKIKYPHCEEKKLSLITAQYSKRYLEQLGYRVILTRTYDYALPLKRRAYIANKSHSDVFVSIHFNSCPNSQANGIEVYYTNEGKKNKRSSSSYLLAKRVLEKTTKRTNFRSRGVKEGNFCVIRETKMPAILLEGGFLTNPEERNQLRQKVFLEKLAKGIAEGVDQFIHQKK